LRLAIASLFIVLKEVSESGPLLALVPAQGKDIRDPQTQYRSCELMKFTKTLIAAGIAAFGAASSAQAIEITVLTGGLYETQVDGATVLDFQTAAPCAGYASCSDGDFAVVDGSSGGQFAAPAGIPSPSDDPNLYLTVPDEKNAGEATFGLGTTANYFGLFWGSIDDYNTLEFYNGSDLVKSIGGEFLKSVDNNILVQGDQVDLDDNRYVNFFFGSDVFDTVRFISSQNAFESDNHAWANIAQVPEPGTLALFGMGIAGLMVARRRKAA
jgi:hypothetical protein